MRTQTRWILRSCSALFFIFPAWLAHASISQSGGDAITVSLGVRAQGAYTGQSARPPVITIGENTLSGTYLDGSGYQWMIPFQFVLLKPEHTYDLTVQTNDMGAFNLNFGTMPPGYTLYIDKQKITAFPGNAGMSSHKIVLHRDGYGLPAGESTDLSVGNIFWGVGLGTLPNGQGAGVITIHEADYSSKLFTRSVLNYGDFDPSVNVVSDGALRQILTPQTFVNIYNISGGFQLDFYPASAAISFNGVLYTFTGTSYVSYTITQGSGTALKITRTANTSTPASIQTQTATYSGNSSNNSWTVNAAGLQIVTKTNAVNAAGDERVETTITQDGAGNTSSTILKIFHRYSFGEQLITEVDDPDGQAYTTNYFYYTDVSDVTNYGLLQSVTYPAGNWVRYKYYNDLSGQVTNTKNRHIQTEYYSWLDSVGVTSATATDSNCRTVNYDWSADWAGDYTLESSRSERVMGYVDALRNTTTKIYTEFTASVASGAPNPLYLMIRRISDYASSPDELVTVTKTFAPNGPPVFANQLYSVQHPDKTMESYAVIPGTWNGGSSFTNGYGSAYTDLKQIVVHGVNYKATDAVQVSSLDTQAIDPIYLIPNQSTKTVTFRQKGLVVREEKYVYSNGDFSLLAATDYTYTPSGKMLSKTEKDGATNKVKYATSAEYTNEFKTADVDAKGTRIEYKPDDLLRIATKTKKGVSVLSDYAAQSDIVTTYTYDGDSNVVVQLTTGGALTLKAAAAFNQAGQPISSTAPGDYTTSYNYDKNGKVVTAILPGGATKVTTNYSDGHVLSETGSSRVAVFYNYSIKGITFDTTQLIGGENSGDWTKVATDWLGRRVATIRPTALSSTTYSYNGSGQLKSSSTTGIAPTLYVYTATGALQVTAQDLNKDGTIDYGDKIGVEDRIAQSDTSFYLDGTSWWLKTTQSIYVDGTKTASVVKTSLARLTGFGAGQIAETTVTDANNNPTNEKTSVDSTNKLVTTITLTPGSNIAAEQKSYNGLAVSSRSTAGVTTTYAYDSLGRLTQVVDPRTLGVKTTYSPGSNLVDHTNYSNDKLIASYTYDTAVRVWTVTDAGGYTKIYGYNDRDQMTSVRGTATLPVDYLYDSFGRLKTQTTYSAGLNDTTATGVTTFVYDSDLPLLNHKRDNSDKSTDYVYDTLGRVNQRTDALNIVTTYNYNPDSGDLSSCVYTNEPTDRPGTPDVSYTYYRTGAVKTVTDATGSRTFVYGTDLQLQQEQLSDSFYGANRTIKNVFDAPGTVTARLGHINLVTRGATPSADTEIQTTSYTYKPDGRIDTIGGNGAGLNSYSFTYGYTAKSDRLVETISNDATGYSQNRGYDSYRNLVTNQTCQFGTSIKVTKAQFGCVYNAIDRRDTETHSGEMYSDYGASPTLSYGYDSAGQLTSAVHSLAGQYMPGRLFGYSYDVGGNRTSANHTGVDDTKEKYEPNALNQIAYHENSVVSVQGTVLAAATVAVEVDHVPATVQPKQVGKFWATEIGLINSNAQGTVSMPAQGLVSIKATQAGAGPNGADLVSTEVTKRAFISGFNEYPVYDDNGNLTSDDCWSYTWDAENRLISMATSAAAIAAGQPNTLLQFTYDYLGRRVGKVVKVRGVVQSERHYVYHGWNLAAEMDEKFDVLRHFIWGLDISGTPGGAGGIGGLLMIQDQEGSSTYFPAYDLSGNVAALLNAADGKLAAIYEYSPFGELLRSEGDYSAKNPFQFSTKFTDSETGLCYYGYRYYSPKLGRFINRDPSGESGGLNLYGFAGNSPSNCYDYLGLNQTLYQPYDILDKATGAKIGSSVATATLTDWDGQGVGGFLLGDLTNYGTAGPSYVKVEAIARGKVKFSFTKGDPVTQTEPITIIRTPPPTPPKAINDPSVTQALSSPNFQTSSDPNRGGYGEIRRASYPSTMIQMAMGAYDKLRYWHSVLLPNDDMGEPNARVADPDADFSDYGFLTPYQKGARWMSFGVNLSTFFMGGPEARGFAAAETTTARTLTTTEESLFSRVSRPKGFKEQVWEINKGSDGLVRDPTGKVLRFDEPWELGHTPGNKFSDAQIRAAEQGWDRATWIKYQNDPYIYRPELPRTNAGHLWEFTW